MAIPYIVRRKVDLSGEAHTGFHRGVIEAVLVATGEIIEARWMPQDSA